MRDRVSIYSEEAAKLPTALGAICGGFTGFLAGAGPSLFSGIFLDVLAKSLSAAAISLFFGVIFGALSGGLLGVLVAIAIPELEPNK